MENTKIAAHIQVKIPKPVHRLGELAFNLWWCWHNNARVLFKMLDRTLWKQTTHRPVKMLFEMSPEQIAQATSDPLFRRAFHGVLLEFDRDIKNGEQLWFPTKYPELMDALSLHSDNTKAWVLNT